MTLILDFSMFILKMYDMLHVCGSVFFQIIMGFSVITREEVMLKALSERKMEYVVKVC
jgi:hypothetical protein